MFITDAWLYPLAAFSGVCFAMMSIFFRFSTERGIPLTAICVVSSVVGALALFLKMGAKIPGDQPLWILFFGFASAFFQYLTIRFSQTLLHYGPVSPLACILALAFIPVIVYSSLIYGESLDAFQYMAVLSALACVLSASLRKHEDHERPAVAEAKSVNWTVYGFTLFLVLIFNAELPLAVKDLAMRKTEGGRSFGELYKDSFLLSLYVSMAVICIIDMLIRHLRKNRLPMKYLLGYGTITGICSVIGMSILAECARLPAAITFTMSGTSSIVVAAILSSLLFREKRNLFWFATIGFGVATVLFANLNGLFGD